MTPLEKPRWPGGPKHCPVANLAAFESMASMKAFQVQNCPSVKIVKEGKCKHCGHWHFKSGRP